MLDKAIEISDINKFIVKQRTARRSNSKVDPRDTKEGDIVFRKIVAPTLIGKFLPNWEGSWMVHQKLPHDVYKLEELDGWLVPRTYNSVNQKYYYI